VIVTGASSGIGRACAILFSSLGARVAIHFSQSEAGARDTLASCLGDGHVLINADFSNGDALETSATALIEKAFAAFGRAPDSLILNHGIFETNSFEQTTIHAFMTSWRRMQTVNSDSLAALTYAFAQKHLEKRQGTAPPAAIASIITVGSRGALRGEPNALGYGSSKSSAHALAQNTAVALGSQGIVAAAVAPGFVATRMARFADEAVEKAVMAQSPWARVASAEECARTVEFAARFWENAWISGSIVNLNGASYLSR
jgi:NAD(P)-dependent dehydrogenase (short-subunit alcohol dehydrogenase family)